MVYGQSRKTSKNTVTLVNLDISLTNLGTLMIKACSYVAPGLQSINLASPEKLQRVLSQGTELWLAPRGNPAKFYSFYDDEQLPGVQPISDLQKYPEDQSWRFHGTTIKSWQSRCLDWLSTKGFDSTLIEEGGWVFVQVLNTNYISSSSEYADMPSLDDGAVVPWPALLCFRVIKTSSAELQPSSGDSFGLVDPLSFAEEWSMNAEKQASIMLTRQQERSIEAAKEQAIGRPKTFEKVAILLHYWRKPDDIPMDASPGSPIVNNMYSSQQHNVVEKQPISSKLLVPQATSQDTIMQDAPPIEDSVQKTASHQHHKTPAEHTADEVPNKNDSLEPSALSRSPPRIMAPFDKETVFGQLVKRTSKISGGPSVYDKVKFEYSLMEIDEKYSCKGRFRYSEDEIKPQLTELRDPTNPESLDRRKSDNKPLESDMLAQILNNDSGPYEFELDNEEEPDMAMNPTVIGMKRKRYFDEGSLSSYNAFTGEYEPSAGTPQSITEPQIPVFESDPADWSLVPYFTSPDPDIKPNGLSDLDLIETAQIIADQAASGNLRMPGQNSQDLDSHAHAILSTRRLMTGVSKATTACLKDVKTCTVGEYLAIPGIALLNTPLRLPPRPMPNPRVTQNSDPLKSSNLFLIQPPQLEVRRGDSKLAVLPPAIHFWDNLGLSPFTGNKDINAICLHPDIVGITENANIFLDQMRGAYESFRFGGHDRIVFPGSPSSLIPYPFDGNTRGNMNMSNAAYLSSLKEIMARLSKNLSSMTTEEKNIVVYIIYPVDNPSLLVQICAAFKLLFKFYRKALSEKKLKPVNELVLQLVPLDFLAAPNSLVVPSPAEYSRLAMEVYDRCVDFASSSTTAAILLEKPLPRSVDFKLAPFHRQRYYKKTPAFILLMLRVLTSGGFLPHDTTTINGNNITSHYDPVSTPQASQSSIFSPDNPSTPSRDSTNAPTPPAPSTANPAVPLEPDQNSRLIDLTDRTWGAILSHRLNNSNSLLELNPALISGYLLKSSGTGTDDPPIVIEVNIIHTELMGHPRTFHDSLLREILGYYRGLATLARVRGVVHPVKKKDLWHKLTLIIEVMIC
ncbi:hypothetical protein DID88_004461 [Monilinia fructigena]|uniref:Mediator of RNA polymerase II transcription subunit 13 n=1 Tax=Monilinia fructigena TaxID=38457 RepID=A0A395IRY6_9HELO|nr:hypothetical protein DID88_004461 [Monilinia fructigena]